MDNQGRRGRRRRGGHSRVNLFASHSFSSHQDSKSCPFLNGFYNIVIMSSLIALIYLMLEYHCNTCNAKCDLQNVTKSIEDIANNLFNMKKDYHELENKISKFSQELPKLEGQIEILEALANSVEGNKMEWNPKSNTMSTLPNVDFKLPEFEKLKNVTKKCGIAKCGRLHCEPIKLKQN